jgi:hypothetical protein
MASSSRFSWTSSGCAASRYFAQALDPCWHPFNCRSEVLEMLRLFDPPLGMMPALATQ